MEIDIDRLKMTHCVALSKASDAAGEYSYCAVICRGPGAASELLYDTGTVLGGMAITANSGTSGRSSAMVPKLASPPTWPWCG